jgi:hypothetical protein
MNPEGPSCRRIMVRDCTMMGCGYAFSIPGKAQQIQFVGNRIVGAIRAGLIVQTLDRETRDIRIANNTFVECDRALLLIDTAIKGKNLSWRNNLLLRTHQPDMVFMEPDALLEKIQGPGDGSRVGQAWQFGHNWREAARPTAPAAKAWIPPGVNDVLRDRIDGVNRDPKSPAFLRPAPDSLLATGGAGKEDPSLPLYVGAVPPEEVPPWDWERTWRTGTKPKEEK